jgi:hypothetical protein
MHAGKRLRLKTHSVTAKVSKAEYDLLVANAAQETMTLSDYARRELRDAVTVSNQEWRVLTFQVMAEEAARLRFEAAQAGEDITGPAVRQRIEDEALVNAGALVNRRLALLARQVVKKVGASQ